jgi:hypothetical protein
MALQFPAWFIQDEANCLRKISCIQVKALFWLSPNGMLVYSPYMVFFFYRCLDHRKGHRTFTKI